jgi:hypothetical protein
MKEGFASPLFHQVHKIDEVWFWSCPFQKIRSVTGNRYHSAEDLQLEPHLLSIGRTMLLMNERREYASVEDILREAETTLGSDKRREIN